MKNGLALLAAVVLGLSGCDTSGAAWSGPSGDGSANVSGDGGHGDGGSDGGVTGCGPMGQCAACLTTNCNTQMTNCFGQLWATGDTHGAPCNNTFACNCDCIATTDGGSSCLARCADKDGMQCQGCFPVVVQCMQKSCAKECAY